jgi:hypothetical protein
MTPMIVEHFNADSALAILKEVYLREGTDAAVVAAMDMISAGAAWIAQESGADEARRILQAAGSAQSEEDKTSGRPRGQSPIGGIGPAIGQTARHHDFGMKLAHGGAQKLANWNYFGVSGFFNLRRNPMDEKQTLSILGWIMGSLLVAIFLMDAIAMSGFAAHPPGTISTSLN